MNVSLLPGCALLSTLGNFDSIAVDFLDEHCWRESKFAAWMVDQPITGDQLPTTFGVTTPGALI